MPVNKLALAAVLPLVVVSLVACSDAGESSSGESGSGDSKTGNNVVKSGDPIMESMYQSTGERMSALTEGRAPIFTTN